MESQDATYEDWKKRFPLCFERTGTCMTFGIEHMGGWNAIVEELLGKIEAHLAEKYAAGFRDPDYGFQIDQIKEKFGTLRFYVCGADDQIFQWIVDAERKTATTCELCGSSGGLHCRKGAYWIRTLCPAHAEEYDYEPYRNEDHDF
jgi:hypothetical protein